MKKVIIFSLLILGVAVACMAERSVELIKVDDYTVKKTITVTETKVVEDEVDLSYLEQEKNNALARYNAGIISANANIEQCVAVQKADVDSLKADYDEALSIYNDAKSKIIVKPEPVEDPIAVEDSINWDDIEVLK